MVDCPGAGICYLYLYAPVASSPYMRTFWADSYLSIGTIRGWKNASDALFGASAGGVIPGLVLAFLGIATMVVRRDWTSLILGGGPIVTTTVLAVLHSYPVTLRLWMFLSPSVAYACAVGAESVVAKLARRLSGQHGRVTAGVLIPILAAGLVRAHNRLHLLNTAFPVIRVLRSSRDKGRDAVAALLRSKSCDPIYVAARSVPTWYFYTSLEPLDNSNRYSFFQSISRRDSPAFGDAAPSALHLPDSAPQLVMRAGCREEVYGLASGTPYRNGLPLQGRVPIAGWAQNELDRISALGTSRFLLYLEDTGPFESDALLGELSRRHLRYRTPDPSFPLYEVQKDYSP